MAAIVCLIACTIQTMGDFNSKPSIDNHNSKHLSRNIGTLMDEKTRMDIQTQIEIKSADEKEY